MHKVGRASRAAGGGNAVVLTLLILLLAPLALWENRNCKKAA